MISSALTAAQTPVNSDGRGRIQHGDVIDVDVIGSFEFDWRGSLTPEGFLDGFDKIEEQVFALCKSEDELAAEIREKYSRVLREPIVRVRIIDKTKRPPALITGAVGKPQRYSINRTVRLNELIILSGGITDSSSGEIMIFRPHGTSCRAESRGTSSQEQLSLASDKPQTTAIKISDILSGSDSANPEIQSGDIVSVVRAFPVYVTGGVNNPSMVTFRSGLSLSRAVAIAGGVSKDAVETEVTVFKRTKGGVEARKVDFAAINAGRSADIELGPYDVINVGQKGRSPRSQPPIIETPGLYEENAERLPLYIID